MRKVAVIAAGTAVVAGLAVAAAGALQGPVAGTGGTARARGDGPKVSASRDPSTFPPALGPACAGATGPGDPSRAADEIQSLGWSADAPYHHSYAGLVMSGGGIAVYRVRNPDLDVAVRRIAAHNGVCVDILDAPLGRWDTERLVREVQGRRAKLAAAGAQLHSIAHESAGGVTVGVSGDVGAARRALADLGEHVLVEYEGPAVPL